MSKINCLFMGTPDFSVPTLRSLLNHPLINLTHVISMPDRKSGRGKKLKSPPVAEFAKEHSISLFQTDNINHEDDFLNSLEKSPIDIIIVIAFAQFLGKKVLSLPRLGSFNIHTSILPKYRGAAPIQFALLNGDKETGVTIQKMVKKMDAGDIGHFKACPIGQRETGDSLFLKLQKLSEQEINYFINHLLSNKVTWTEQNEKKASYAPSFTKKDGLIDAFSESALSIERKVRAFHSWPGTYFFLNGQRVKVLESELSTLKTKVGIISTSQGTLVLGTIDGPIRFTKIQFPGKKPSTDQQVINNLKSSKKIFEMKYATEESL